VPCHEVHERIHVRHAEAKVATLGGRECVGVRNLLFDTHEVVQRVGHDEAWLAALLGPVLAAGDGHGAGEVDRRLVDVGIVWVHVGVEQLYAGMNENHLTFSFFFDL